MYMLVLAVCLVLYAGTWFVYLINLTALNVARLFPACTEDDAYRNCTTQMECSETCVRAYMDRYASRCTGERAPTCQDFARIHNGGPNGCRKSATLRHWQRVQRCCNQTDTDSGHCDKDSPDHSVPYHSSSVTSSALDDVTSSGVPYHKTAVSFNIQTMMTFGAVALTRWLHSRR